MAGKKDSREEMLGGVAVCRPLPGLTGLDTLLHLFADRIKPGRILVQLLKQGQVSGKKLPVCGRPGLQTCLGFTDAGGPERFSGIPAPASLLHFLQPAVKIRLGWSDRDNGGILNAV
jgi:hypothetical protein